jgi:hypothetical protein
MKGEKPPLGRTWSSRVKPFRRKIAELRRSRFMGGHGKKTEEY